jgi:MFS family permease
LGLTFLVALFSMHDIGFEPRKDTSVWTQMRGIVRSSFDHGVRNPPVRWLMFAAPFGGGVGIYGFYAMQPYLLELYGRGDSYAIAGLAGAIVAGTQILGGYLVPHLKSAFKRRTSFLVFGTVVSAISLALIGLVSIFWAALVLFGSWAIVFAATTPVRQAFINGLIPSEERATILSSDNLLASTGGVFVQPALGRIADAWSYSVSYLVAACIQLLALPLVLLSRRERASSDPLAVRS